MSRKAAPALVSTWRMNYAVTQTTQAAVSEEQLQAAPWAQVALKSRRHSEYPGSDDGGGSLTQLSQTSAWKPLFSLHTGGHHRVGEAPSNGWYVVGHR